VAVDNSVFLGLKLRREGLDFQAGAGLGAAFVCHRTRLLILPECDNEDSQAKERTLLGLTLLSVASGGNPGD